MIICPAIRYMSWLAEDKIRGFNTEMEREWSLKQRPKVADNDTDIFP